MKAEPSLHFTPLRSLNVHSLPSAFGVQDVASDGASVVPSPCPQRYSKLSVTTEYVPRSAILVGFSGPLGFWAVIRSVPPALAFVVFFLVAAFATLPPATSEGRKGSARPSPAPSFSTSRRLMPSGVDTFS